MFDKLHRRHLNITVDSLWKSDLVDMCLIQVCMNQLYNVITLGIIEYQFSVYLLLSTYRWLEIRIDCRSDRQTVG